MVPQPTQGDENRRAFDGAAMARGQSCAPPKGMKASTTLSTAEQAPRSNGEPIACFGRQVVRNAG